MRRLSTRLLLTCAAIGVAGGLVYIVEGLVSGAVAAALPFLYGATLGVYFFPGALAQALLRRPGVALFAAAIAGVVVTPFTPIGARAIGGALLIGLLQEVPFALTRYRVWRASIAYLGAAVAGALLSLVVLFAMDVVRLEWWFGALAVAVSIAAPVLVTGAARAIAAGVERTGATRGLAREQPAARRD